MEETKTLEELKTEAQVLGINFNPKIGIEKLSAKIEEHYNSLSAEDSVKYVEDEISAEVEVTSKVQSTEVVLRRMIEEAKKAAMKTKIVTISSNDKRDSEFTTTAYLSMENQYFGVARIVPLDIPIELEVCLIEVARATEITLHKDEIINGKRTGNKVPVKTRKYNISYGEQLK